MAQYARPNATDFNNGFTLNGDSTLHACVDDETPDEDTTYIEGDTADENSQVSLSSVSDPQVSTGHVVVMRTKASGSGGPEKINWGLFDGVTKIAGQNGVAITRTSYNNDVNYTLSTSEADAIGNYSNLKLYLYIDTVGSGETIRFTQVYFECPDAPSVVPLAASFGGSGDLASAFSIDRALASTIAGAGALDDNPIKVLRALGSTIAGTGSLDGAVNVLRALISTLAGSGDLSGVLSTLGGEVLLAAVIAGTGSLSGAASVLRKLASTLPGTGDISANVSRIRGIASTLPGSGDLAGDASILRAIAASLDGAGGLTGAFEISRKLAAVIPGTGGLQGLLRIEGEIVYIKTQQFGWVSLQRLLELR